ncbi:MAG: hypothetical protein ACLTQI_03715 [Slackia sp.]
MPQHAAEKTSTLSSRRNDLLRIDIDDYLDTTFFCQVLDEAQYIKTMARLLRAPSNACIEVSLRAYRNPMENRLSEI